jgi:predicted dehydrogenase
MHQQKIKWGILGAGKIAHAFAKDFQYMQNAELVAIASTDLERAKTFATEYNMPQVLSYDELYASKEVDAVYVATTHNFHYEQSLQCLQNGKAVLCEKPITVNDRECKMLIDLSKNKQVFLMEAMWTYFLPAIQKAKQWLAEGRIGQLKMLQADFCFSVEKKLEGRMYNAHLAGGSLLDLGVYPVSIAYYFMDQQPNAIASFGHLTKTGVDENVNMLFQYADATANLTSSMVSRGNNTCYLFGEKGSIEIPEFWRTKACKLYDNDRQLIDSFEDGRIEHGFIYEMQHANDCISKGAFESPIMPHARSYAIQQSMTQVRKQIGLQYPFEKD